MLIDSAPFLLTQLATNYCAYPIWICTGNVRLFPARVPTLVDFLNVSR